MSENDQLAGMPKRNAKERQQQLAVLSSRARVAKLLKVCEEAGLMITVHSDAGVVEIGWWDKDDRRWYGWEFPMAALEKEEG